MSSPSLTPIGVAIIGAGTVGGGVAHLLQTQQETLQRLCQRPIRITHVVKRNLSNTAHLPDSVLPLLTDDWRTAVADNNTDIVVELMGGEDTAAECIRTAHAAGKMVVSANKALLASFGKQSDITAQTIAHEAAIAGCIPIVKIIREALAGDTIREIYGVINGTCNYILTTMETTKQPFADTLTAAQQLGYAEADPGLDIDGLDTAHKLVLLCRLAFGADVRIADVPVIGVRDFDWRDIDYAKQFNFRIKLLAIAKHIGDHLEVRVRPTLVSRQHLLAAVDGAINAVVVRADFSGETLYCGAGAGASPTAVAVVADIIDLTRNLAPTPPLPLVNAPTPTATFTAPYYLRLCLIDQPGVLADVTRLLAKQTISIEAIHQNESKPGNPVDVVILLHNSDSDKVTQAIAHIQQLAVIQAPIVAMPIERLET